MLRIFLIVSLFFGSLFANVDGHIDIVKRASSIPKIAVSMASDSSGDFTLSRLKKSLEEISLLLHIDFGIRDNDEKFLEKFRFVQRANSIIETFEKAKEEV